MSIDGSTTEGQVIQILTTFSMWACQKSVITWCVLHPRITSWHSLKKMLSGYNRKYYVQDGQPNSEYQVEH